MADLSLEIQVGLAEILGLVAVVASLLIWRMGEFPQLFKQIRLHSAFIETGLAPQRIYKARYKLLLHGLLRISGIVGCLVFFGKTYHYLDLVRLLVAHSASVDSGLFERLQAHTENEKTDLVLLGFISSSLFALDWIVALLLTSGVRHVEEQDVPSYSHLYMVPEQWRTAFTAMWEDRIERASAHFNGRQELKRELEAARETRGWHADWPTWAKCVAGYHAAISSRRE